MFSTYRFVWVGVFLLLTFPAVLARTNQTELTETNASENLSLYLGDPFAVKATGRKLLEFGNELLVNTYTSGKQERPVIAAYPNLDFLTVWMSDQQDGSSWGIYAQRLSSVGTKIGSEFIVNDITLHIQEYPAVCVLNGGGPVIVWTSWSDINSNLQIQIHARRFNSNNAAIGASFQVSNSQVSKNNQYAGIAALADGGFVIVWAGTLLSASRTVIFAKRFNSAGVAIGSEFLVSSLDSSSMNTPIVASFANGGFIVAFRAWNGLGNSLYARRFDSSSTPLEIDFQVNVEPLTSSNPSIATLADNRFIISWVSSQIDGTFDDIFARRYAANGNPASTEFRVNTYRTSTQYAPKAIKLGDGGFLIAWMSYDQIPTFWSIFGQRYDANGVRVGTEFQISQTASANRDYPDLVGIGNDGFAVVYNSYTTSNTLAMYMLGFLLQISFPVPMILMLNLLLHLKLLVQVLLAPNMRSS